MSFEDHFFAADPVTRDALLFLTEYKEEDDRVDYKATVTIESEKEWLGLTKDISAFANTLGGYIVFGIDDVKKEVVGLIRDVVDVLREPNYLHQKINRHVEPDITSLRSKPFRIEGKTLILLHVPQSKNKTHIIKKDGSYKLPSKKSKTILHQGTFYVRRSGGNHLGDSRDHDELIERRIEQFRDSLLEKVARVVRAPAESNVFILSRDPEDKTGERFVIEDSPDSIPVKGMSFSVSPETDEEEIAAWHVLSTKSIKNRPPIETVWNWYASRDQLNLRPKHRLSLFQFSLWANAPSLYWIQGLENSDLRPVLLNAIRQRPTGVMVKPYLVAASFLGKSTYREAIKVLGDYITKIPNRMTMYPTRSPLEEFVTFRPNAKQSIESFKEQKLEQLNSLVAEIVSRDRPPGGARANEAQELDWYLYANTNNYKSGRTVT